MGFTGYHATTQVQRIAVFRDFLRKATPANLPPVHGRSGEVGIRGGIRRGDWGKLPNITDKWVKTLACAKPGYL